MESLFGFQIELSILIIEKISKHYDGGEFIMTDPRIREHDQYVEYNKLSLIEQFKRRYNIAKSLIRNPNINNVINAGQALLGEI